MSSDVTAEEAAIISTAIAAYLAKPASSENQNLNSDTLKRILNELNLLSNKLMQIEEKINGLVSGKREAKGGQNGRDS